MNYPSLHPAAHAVPLKPWEAIWWPYWGASPTAVTISPVMSVSLPLLVFQSVNLLQQNIIAFLPFFSPICSELGVFPSVFIMDPNHSVFHSNVNPKYSIITFQNSNKKEKYPYVISVEISSPQVNRTGWCSSCLAPCGEVPVDIQCYTKHSQFYSSQLKPHLIAQPGCSSPLRNYLSPFPFYIFDRLWWEIPTWVLMSFHRPSLQQGAVLDGANLAPQFLFPKRKWWEVGVGQI